MRWIAVLAGLMLGGGVVAQAPRLADQRAKLIAAKRDAAFADRRAADLNRAAAVEDDRADRAQAQERALAARVAASEAAVAAAEARRAIIDGMLAQRRAELGAAQTPVARLLAALQSLARRPPIAAVAQPGSVDDLVHVRAVLGSALPVVRARTAAVRIELDETRRLQRAAGIAAAALRQGRATLESDRVALATLEAAHRRRSRALGRDALSESDRALALGERARDLVDRMTTDDMAEATAADLARLSGPTPRPLAEAAAPPRRSFGVYRLPVAGRLITGLDELSSAGVRSRGLTFAVPPSAPVFAPAAGVVRYARRFRAYGAIVIIGHDDGWTTLVTGLAGNAVKPGQLLAMGDPIGVAAGGEDPRVTVELRRRGRPVDIAALAG